jgi:hypothetical protein
MFCIVNGVLLQGLPFTHAERIVDLNEVERRDIGGGGAIAPATFFDWRKMATSYDVMAVFATRIYNVTPTTGRAPRVCAARWPQTTFFDVLGVSPILGRGFMPQDSEPGQGQEHRPQLRDSGSGSLPASRTSSMNRCVSKDGPPYTIVGVMPATVNFPETSNFWLPAAHDVPSCSGPNGIRAVQRGAHCLRGIGRLKDGTSLQQANAELTTISDQLAKQYPKSRRTSLASRGSLQDRLVGSARTPLLVLLGRGRLRLTDRRRECGEPPDGSRHRRARELAIRAAMRRRSIDPDAPAAHGERRDCARRWRARRACSRSGAST